MAGAGTDYGLPTLNQTSGIASDYPELDQRATRSGRQSDQSINIKQRVGSSDITLFTADEDKGGSVLPSAKSLQFMNEGNSVLAVQVKLVLWEAATTEDTTHDYGYLQFLVRQGETINFPMSRVIASTVDGLLTGTEDDLANTAPDSNMYRDSGITLGANLEDNATQITTSANGTNAFSVGDLVQVGIDTNTITRIEILKVTGISSTTVMTVDRALYGTSAADKDNQTDGTSGAVSGAKIYLPFFNTYHDHDALTTARTDNDGKFAATNFFGYGRGTDIPTSGLLPGSVAIKCYNPGYQELGLSGITPGTNSGLTAGETYYFKITVDGGTQIEVSFTVDSNNTNFGGRNGILSKVQDFFNTQYYTTGSALFETKVTVGIVNGDIRFTSGSYLSTSAIALAAGTSGAGATVRWFGHATTVTGRIPGLNNIPSAVAASLPDDTVIDPATGNTISNSNAFMYDDGYGNLVGNGTGTINYDTGAIDFTSKPNAEFVVSAIHTGALAGNVTETAKNTIMQIKARSLNTKVEGKINVVIGG